MPASYDPSVLLTTAGMHPLKPYFLGQEQPPHHRLTTCQKCFRTPDIEEVGTTTRHLTFFEMLGNFSIGDYFKQGAVELAWELSLDGFGFEPEDIWITVFEGDEELGLGPDEEAIEAWLSVGVPRERIVLLPALGELLAGRPDRARAARARSSTSTAAWSSARPTTCPAATTSASSSTGTSCSCSTTRTRSRTLTPLPKQNIDTGLGLNRMALIQQGTDVDLRDRPVPAADRARRGAVGPPLRRATSRPTARCGSSPTTRAA